MVWRGLSDANGEFVALSSAMLPIWPGPFFDSTTAEDCYPVWTPEGKVRCVPFATQNPTWVGAYADAACTEPAFYCSCFDVPCNCAEGQPPLIPHLVKEYGEVRADSLHEARPLDTVYSLATGKCTSGEATPPSNYFAAGATVSWDTYPELTELNPRP